MSHQNDLIAESIDYLVANYDKAPRLEALAKRAGYDAAHFQKLFKSYVGISPKRLVQYMNIRQARSFLLEGCSTLDAAYKTGLSSPSRLHDLFVTVEGMTPGEVKNRGQGVEIIYGFAPCAIGEVMIGKTARGVCWLGFLMDQDRQPAIARVQSHWPKAKLLHNDAQIRSEAADIMKIWSGAGDQNNKLKLDLYGTNFQLQVWQALLKIPTGCTLTYKDIAQDVCSSKASRAVGNAVGANPISLLIPCHRVIRGTGIIDNYGWGSPRKKLLLALEAQPNSHEFQLGFDPINYD